MGVEKERGHTYAMPRPCSHAMLSAIWRPTRRSSSSGSLASSSFWIACIVRARRSSVCGGRRQWLHGGVGSGLRTCGWCEKGCVRERTQTQQHQSTAEAQIQVGAHVADTAESGTSALASSRLTSALRMTSAYGNLAISSAASCPTGSSFERAPSKATCSNAPKQAARQGIGIALKNVCGVRAQAAKGHGAKVRSWALHSHSRQQGATMVERIPTHKICKPLAVSPQGTQRRSARPRDDTRGVDANDAVRQACCANTQFLARGHLPPPLLLGLHQLDHERVVQRCTGAWWTVQATQHHVREHNTVGQAWLTGGRERARGRARKPHPPRESRTCDVVAPAYVRRARLVQGLVRAQAEATKDDGHKQVVHAPVPAAP